MNSPRSHQLFQKLLSLKLPPADFVVFGSAPMWLHGIKELGNDLDVLARGRAWEAAGKLGHIAQAQERGKVVTLFDGEIEIFNEWAPGSWDTDELVETAMVVEGIRFASLENVRKWKEVFGREKDLKDVELIDIYLRSRGYPYRSGVEVLVLSKDGRILLAQKAGYADGQWGFIGGGVEPGDINLEATAIRETEEEIGITDFEVIGQSKFTNKFDWPVQLIQVEEEKGRKFRGQEKPIFVIQSELGSESYPEYDKRELQAIKWVKPSELASHMVFTGQAELFTKILQEFELI